MTYTITIQNRTGAPQSYSLIAAPLNLSGGGYGSLVSNVTQVAGNVSNDARTTLSIGTNYCAIAGSYNGDPNRGGRAMISTSMPVQLGKMMDGNITMGSTVDLQVNESSLSQFGAPENPGQGNIGSFEVTTSNDFSVEDVLQHGVFTGVGSATDGGSVTALSTFIPYPHSRYQVQVQVVYYVAAGSRFEVGQAVKLEMIGSSVAVDFAARGTSNVQLIHDATGRLKFA